MTDASAKGLTERIPSAYRHHLRGRPVEASLVATFAYLLTLVVVRVFTTVTHTGSGDDVVIGATHIHHVCLESLPSVGRGFLAG